MDKKYSIAVWDIQFCKFDEDGRDILNEDGSVKLFTDRGFIDLSYVCEAATDGELWEVE